MIEELRARKVKFAELHALDDERGGASLPGEDDAMLPVGDVAAFDFSRVDLAFFCGRAALSERYAQLAAGHAWVIDGSAVHRTRADVPLVAADVNARVLDSVGERAQPGPKHNGYLRRDRNVCTDECGGFFRFLKDPVSQGAAPLLEVE